MGLVEVFDSEKDKSKWEESLPLLPAHLQDIYYTPDYVSMHRFINDSKSILFRYQEQDKIWLYPFLLQPIDTKKYPNGGNKYFDIESAHGYGGPLTNDNNKEF